MSEVIERIFARAIKTPSGCWEWQGPVTHNGYGRVQYQGRTRMATRVVCAELLGLDINDRATFACHRCDNPACVNPDHLFLGDAFANMRDSSAKGRRPKEQPKKRLVMCQSGRHEMSETRERRWDGATHCGVCYRERQAAKVQARSERRRLARERAA